jgi:predicted nucleotidyltransferase
LPLWGTPQNRLAPLGNTLHPIPYTSSKINMEELLLRIKKIILEKEPKAKVYLFGSRARGTTHRDSDWDLLILLKKDTITQEIEKNVTYPLYDLEFETGEVISPIVYSEKEWNIKHVFTPFYANVMKEGILL